MAVLRVEMVQDDVPQMLRAILLNALAAAPDVEVVDASPSALGATAVVVDALIAGADFDARGVLRSGRVGRVIRIDADGRAAEVHWLENRSRRVEPLSIQRLLAMLRAAPQVAAPPARPVLPGWMRLRWLPGRPTDTTVWTARMSADPTIVPVAPLASPDAPPPPLVTAAGALLEGPAPDPAPEPAPIDPVTARLARIMRRIADARGSAARQGDAFAAIAAALGPGDAATELPGLTFLADRFGLDADDCDLLFLAAVVEVDPRAAQMMALLNEHPGRPRPVAGSVAHWGGDVRGVIERLAGDGPLVRHALVALDGDGPLAARMVVADPAVWPLVLGMTRTCPFAVEALPDCDPTRLDVPDDVRAEVARIAANLRHRDPTTIFVAVTGDEEVGRGAIARTLAAAVARQLIAVAGGTVLTPEAIAALTREATIASAAVVVVDPEAMPAELWRRLVGGLASAVFAVANPERIKPLLLATPRAAITVVAPRRDRAQRLRMWRTRAPADWTPDALDDLADRFDFGNARIDAALGLASAEARAAGRRTPDPDDARMACDRVRDTRFGSAAERLELRFAPDDIVLRAETRRELDLAVAWARHGARLFGDDGPAASLHAGSGLACLFTGPPGTGKTMAAQIIAREVDYALYRVDLSQVVDKYIGEGEKRISSLFKEAGRARVALFFDEADALFSKRTDVKESRDHYANIAVNHMLQEIERFPGWAILATNLSGNIDNAFMRRIRVRADFPAPGPADRCAIWERLLPPAEARGDIVVAPLAEPYELVGGEIRNAVYTAHLLAARDGAALAMRHCAAGLAREVGKSGRIADLAALEPWLAPAGRARPVRVVG